MDTDSNREYQNVLHHTLPLELGALNQPADSGLLGIPSSQTRGVLFELDSTLPHLYSGPAVVIMRSQQSGQQQLTAMKIEAVILRHST